MSDNEQGDVVSFADARARAEAEAAEAMRARARQQARRRDGQPETKPWLTWTLIGVNALIWVVMAAAGVDAFQPTADALLAWGGNLGFVAAQGQWWRFLTAMFLHAGIVHLAFNLYFLWVIGRVCEQIFGPSAYALVYFGSGLLASLVSALWQPAVVSVGASGALFGVFGAFVAFTIRRRDTLPPDFVKSVRRNALILIGLNLAIGVAVPGIDLAAHIGGLAAGLGIGYLIAKLAEKPVATQSEARSLRLRAIGITAALTTVCLVAGSFALPRYDDPRPVVERVSARHDQAMAAYDEAQDVDARIAVLEDQVIPTLREGEAEFAELDNVPAHQRSAVEQFQRYFELRREAAERELEGLRNNDPLAIAEAKALHAQADAVLGNEM